MCHSLTSELQPTLTPPPQQKKYKITMQQWSTPQFILTFQHKQKYPVTGIVHKKDYQIASNGEFLQSMLCQRKLLKKQLWKQERSGPEKRSASSLTAAPKPQLKEAPEKAEMFCVLSVQTGLKPLRLSSFTGREKEPSRSRGQDHTSGRK